jgi:hypothetical protein
MLRTGPISTFLYLMRVLPASMPSPVLNLIVMVGRDRECVNAIQPDRRYAAAPTSERNLPTPLRNDYGTRDFRERRRVVRRVSHLDW